MKYPVEIVRTLPVDGKGAVDQTLVRGEDGRYWVISSVRFETLVFPADEDGEITRFLEVAGGKGMSQEDAIADLSEVGPREYVDYGDDGDDPA